MTDAATAVSALHAALASGAEDKAMQRYANDASIARQIEQFKKAVAAAPDLATALRNPKVLNVILTANGMSDAIGQTGLAVRALLSDPSDEKSVVNSLTDTRWKTLAQTFNFSTLGLSALQDSSVVDSLTTGLKQQKWYGELDAANPGTSAAMNFVSNAGSVTTAYQILGDATLRKVVTGALGLPLQIAIQPLPTQAKAITSRLDLATLQDSKVVQRLADRYMIAQAASSSTTTTTDPRVALLQAITGNSSTSLFA